MFGSLFGKRGYQPAIRTGEPLVRSVAEVPTLVAKLAKSFSDGNGKRAPIESHWIYTGTGRVNALDQARFARTIGARLGHPDALDGVVSVIDRTHVSLAFHQGPESIGIHWASIPLQTEAGFMRSKTAFISDRDHLIRDRPLSEYLAPDVRQQFRASFPGTEEPSSDQLARFVLSHPRREEIGYSTDGSREPDRIVHIPNSLEVDIFATDNSYHPTRHFYGQLTESKFENGELFVDGHIHGALTPRRVGNDPLLAALSRKYGPIRAAAVLSLSDVRTIMEMKDVSQHFRSDAPIHHAARELYVIDDGVVVDHSVLNILWLWSDEQRIARFQEISKRALSSPNNLDTRMDFHAMMHDFTTPKGIDEPLMPRDYE